MFLKKIIINSVCVWIFLRIRLNTVKRLDFILKTIKFNWIKSVNSDVNNRRWLSVWMVYAWYSD